MVDVAASFVALVPTSWVQTVESPAPLANSWAMSSTLVPVRGPEKRTLIAGEYAPGLDGEPLFDVPALDGRSLTWVSLVQSWRTPPPEI